MRIKLIQYSFSLLILTLFTSCELGLFQKTVKEKYSWEAIHNTTNCLNYIKFLNMYPETEHFEDALTVLMDCQSKSNFANRTAYNKNILEVRVYPHGRTLVNGKEVKPDQIPFHVLFHLSQLSENRSKTDSKIVIDNSGDSTLISKGKIHVMYKAGDMTKLQNVIEQVAKGVSHYKLEITSFQYNLIPSSRISRKQNDFLDSLLNTKIWFSSHKEFLPTSYPENSLLQLD